MCTRDRMAFFVSSFVLMLCVCMLRRLSAHGRVGKSLSMWVIGSMHAYRMCRSALSHIDCLVLSWWHSREGESVWLSITFHTAIVFTTATHSLIHSFSWHGMVVLVTGRLGGNVSVYLRVRAIRSSAAAPK